MPGCAADLLRRHLGRYPALAVAAAAIFALEGCGGNRDATSEVTAATARTLSQTAGSSLTLEGAPLFGATEKPVLARAGFLFERGIGFEAMDIPDVDRHQGGRVYLVFLPRAVYIRPSPAAAATLPPGKSWVVAPLSRSVDTVFPRLVEQVEGLNPQLLLDEIAWGAETVSAEGHEVVDHVPFARYNVTVSLDRALAGATGPGAEAMQLAIEDQLEALKSSRPGGPATVAVKVWVDGPGRVARLQAVLPGSGLGTVGFVLSGFGSTIRSSLPSASELVAITSLPRPTGVGSRSPLLAFGLAP